MSENEYLLVLNAITGLGNRKKLQLLLKFRSASKIFSLTQEEWELENVISSCAVEQILTFDKEDFLKREYALMKSEGVSVVTLIDSEYPDCIKTIADAPLVLYIKGTLNVKFEKALAMVGSRRASLYGLNTCERFATELSDYGFTIVSGMARGIDTAAHRGALKSSSPTIAVLGCGLTHVYPPENKTLMNDIVNNGAVISEFAMQMPPLAYNFPRRNRIISGLSCGVIVVEAAKKSGALITADFALDQGRDVYAIPGKIDNPAALGVNALIKQGAILVSSVEDILEEVAARQQIAKPKKTAVVSKSEKQKSQITLTDPEKELLRGLSDTPVHIDELVSLYQKDSSITTALLFQLELKRLVRQWPGKMFSRNKTKR